MRQLHPQLIERAAQFLLAGCGCGITVHDDYIDSGQGLATQAKRFSTHSLDAIAGNSVLGALFSDRHTQTRLAFVVNTPKDGPVTVGDTFVAFKYRVVVTRC